MKIRLDLDTLAVQSFDTGRADAVRGTVRAHQDLSDHCNTRQPFCELPSVDIPCITEDAECQ